jgi:hypothetical protein
MMVIKLKDIKMSHKRILKDDNFRPYLAMQYLADDPNQCLYNKGWQK